MATDCCPKATEVSRRERNADATLLTLEVFTSGQVARLCKVGPKTACAWFDKGLLRGYRIPGGRDRRVLRADLIRFLKDNAMPTWGLEDDATQDRRDLLLAIGTLRDLYRGEPGAFERAESLLRVFGVPPHRRPAWCEPHDGR